MPAWIKKPETIATLIGIIVFASAFTVVLNRRDEPTEEEQETERLAEMMARDNCLSEELLARYQEVDRENEEAVQELVLFGEEMEGKRDQLIMEYDFSNVEEAQAAVDALTNRSLFDKYFWQQTEEKCGITQPLES